MRGLFRYFNSLPEVIRLTVMMCTQFSLALRQVEDLLSERGIDTCRETLRFWWNRFGPMLAAATRLESGLLAYKNGTRRCQRGLDSLLSSPAFEKCSSLLRRDQVVCVA